jgi:hypothetical protein
VAEVCEQASADVLMLAVSDRSDLGFAAQPVQGHGLMPTFLNLDRVGVAIAVFGQQGLRRPHLGPSRVAWRP